jgi:hypothetical protein
MLVALEEIDDSPKKQLEGPAIVRGQSKSIRGYSTTIDDKG